MKTALLLFLLILVPKASFPDEPASPGDSECLVKTVSGFWKARQKNDRLKAMEFVHPEDLNLFLNQKPARIKGWRIAEIESGETHNEVKVRVEYTLETYPGTAFKVASLDTWQLVDGEWKVRIKQPSRSALEALFGQSESSRKQPDGEEITIRPDTIRFFKLNLGQPAFIWIDNQLGIPAEITGLEYDRELIKAVELPEIIEPGENARIRLEYIGGKQEQENLATSVKLKVTAGERVFEKEVQAVYNYMNDALRWLRKTNPQATGQSSRPPE